MELGRNTCWPFIRLDAWCTILEREGQSKPVVLPAEKAGVMMVFRTFDKVRYALVMNATRPVHIGDTVQSPQ